MIFLIIFAGYFAFIIWVSIAAGENQPANLPTPIITQQLICVAFTISSI